MAAPENFPELSVDAGEVAEGVVGADVFLKGGGGGGGEGVLAVVFVDGVDEVQLGIEDPEGVAAVGDADNVIDVGRWPTWGRACP